MLANITVYSTNKQTLIDFNSFIIKFYQRTSSKKKMFLVENQSNIKKNRFSILKSPHVNKKAQEHYHRSIHRKCFEIYFINTSVLLVFLKTLQLKSFSGLNIKISLSLNSNKFKKRLEFLLNLNNISLRQAKRGSTNIVSVQKYLQLLDAFGETLFIK